MKSPRPTITTFYSSVNNLFKRAFELLSDLLFPAFCVGCKKEGQFLCPSCESKIDYFTKEICIVCQKPSIKGFTHHTCATKFTPERIYSVFFYHGIVRKAILSAKYGKAYKALDPLIDIFSESIAESGVDFGLESIVIPIPLHFLRKIDRGYNQAEYIADRLAKYFHLKIDTTALKRQTFTSKQAKLTKVERKRNVENAFVVSADRVSQVKGKDIVLVDDIETSGATMLSASKALKQAGCRYIYCIAFSKD
ncbi:hypothetical protein COT49_02415 [candidate division WWE3 bacterium CG08_land_8_20_14_0_20_40_13]|uniref:Phosphoribosyltransferase domain-containing protein n=1 Tax=candidate division WWE3 bacterium CG08_land_8_20_14_0_20_40_13 TaxID=1975084 RepID=A0A2H0XDP2_UNCKA|nr:MAG: hypothetical protein COT49_02415 [candidate division WWE3 bacterium CG08_land_8_20_14_0_20_40_13]